MTTGQQYIYIPNRVIDSRGLAVGASIYFYLSGTTTKIDVFTDADLSTPAANPTVVNAGAAVPYRYWNPDLTVRVRVVATTGEVISDQDPWTGFTAADILLDDGKSIQEFADGFGIMCYPTDTEDQLRAKIALANGGGYVLQFVSGSYQIANVETNLNNLTVQSLGGVVNILKNDNGPIWTHTGRFGLFQGIFFSGQNEFDPETGTPISTWTGPGIVFTEDGCRLINCGCVYSNEEALIAYKKIFVNGSNPKWSTADESGTQYDIVNGIDTTDPNDVCLYSQFTDVYTSTPWGGMKFLNCGSQTVKGGQIGKYTVTATDPASALTGTNGGHLDAVRVVGNVQIDVSSALATNCQFGGDTMTFGQYTSNCSFGETNGWKPTAVINNLGNSANYIARNTGASDGAGGIKLCYGASGSGSQGGGAELWVLPTNSAGAPDPANASLYTPGFWRAQYNKGYKSLASDGTTILNVALVYAADGSVQFGHTTGSATTAIAAGSGGIAWAQNSQIARLKLGTASPNGSVIGSPGDLFLNVSGGAGTTLWVKESGSATNTGWVGK